MTTANHFNRGITKAFVDALNEKYREGDWWKQIVTDKDLFIGIRPQCLNVYYNGASLLELEYAKHTFTGKTHFKYLRRDKPGDEYVRFDDGRFASVDWEPQYDNIGDYLKQIKKAAGKQLGKEKRGVHQICCSNDNVIDVEIAVPGAGARIDFAALREEKSRLKLVFYEAKVYQNLDIDGVVRQVTSYEKILSERAEEVKKSYLRVCSNIRALEGYPRRNLVDKDFVVSPKVRLVVFGYNESQRKAADDAKGVFSQLRKQLGENRVITRGKARGLVMGISR